MSDFFCPACQAAIRAAGAALDVFNDVDASDEDRRIAAEELVRAVDQLRPPPALRADEEADR